jgi:hypothetical protein
MSIDPTLPQPGQDRLHSRELSLQRQHPPVQVPGYEPERLLGVGAFGEVWVAVEQNTGRRVAIKFYAHRGGLDWSLLSREVEKLAFLFADRYVVQLIGVGWNAEPPYYIMEYLQQGSLADRLKEGTLPAAEAVELFGDIAVGLMHAHGKGVLHCDLKPANVLLDQDKKPRLADFGQSRLSHEQAPALGTLFYMAPEQADLTAVPDARWDVYALGALLYCMLTGRPPHRNDEVVAELEKADDLQKRLSSYRRLIRKSPPPTEHRSVPGVDRALATIIERCLAPDPSRRYPNVQALLAALDARRGSRARRPLVLLGTIGPALILLVVWWFALQGFSTALKHTDDALTQRALQSNRFAARYVARAAAGQLERLYRAVEQMAQRPELQQILVETIDDPEFDALSRRLSDPRATASMGADSLAALRQQFRDLPERRQLQQRVLAMLPEPLRPPEGNGDEDAHDVASWFICDPRGMSTVRIPESLTIGKNFAYRSYFYGGPADKPESWRPAPGEHLKETRLSDVFRSHASYRWIVAIATPIYDRRDDDRFLGVIALTVQVGRLIELEGGDQQFPVLIDWRDGKNKGRILQHPLFDRVLDRRDKLPEHFQKYHLTAEQLPNTQERKRQYVDPLGDDALGRPFRRKWLAEMEPIEIRDRESGWLVIVQQSHLRAIGDTLLGLRASLIGYGLVALTIIAMVLVSVWGLALRLLNESAPSRLIAPADGNGDDAPSPSVTPDATTQPHRPAADASAQEAQHEDAASGRTAAEDKTPQGPDRT